MKIHGERQDLLEVGQSVLRVVSPRATLPVLGGVRISAGPEGVQFASTDLEIFVTVQRELSVDEEGSLVVPGRLFGEILRSLPSGKVTITGADGEVRIESGRTEFSLRGFPVADFPKTPDVPEGVAGRVPGPELAKALGQVVRAASTDEARPVLTGVLWMLEGGLLRLVATDSYRLAVSEVVAKEGPNEAQAIIPGRALSELARHITAAEDQEVSVWLGETQAAFSVGRTRLVTRLIEGEFPNWRHLIPEQFESKLHAPRDGFASAVERVGLVAQPNTPVKFHLSEEVQLTANEAGVADAVEFVEEANYTGSPMVVAFNPRFFREGLEGIDTENAVLEVIDPTKPAILRGEDREDYMYLVMPVRLPN